MSKILFQLSLGLGLLLLVVGSLMKFFSIESKGWYFTKKGVLTNGTLDANGTLFLSIIILLFAMWNRKFYMQEKKEINQKRNIERNERRLSKNYNIYKIRKANKN